VREGLLQGLQSLHERHSVFRTVPKDLSVLDGHVVLASSSAAGGLRIVVVGNVPGLTVKRRIKPTRCGREDSRLVFV
jgi:hypothetical protein